MSNKSNRSYYDKLVKIIVARKLAEEIDGYLPDKFMLSGEQWKMSDDIYYIERWHRGNIDKIINDGR